MPIETDVIQVAAWSGLAAEETIDAVSVGGGGPKISPLRACVSSEEGDRFAGEGSAR